MSTSAAGEQGPAKEAAGEQGPAKEAAGEQGPAKATGEQGPAKRGELDEWVDVVVRELGLDPADAQTDRVLDLARDVAHGVVRPGAPVTAYLMGLAVGRGADPAEVAQQLSGLAHTWTKAKPG